MSSLLPLLCGPGLQCTLLGFENRHMHRSCRLWLKVIKGGNDPGDKQKGKKTAVGLQSKGARGRDGRLVKIKAVRWGRPEAAETGRQHCNF